MSFVAREKSPSLGFVCPPKVLKQCYSISQCSVFFYECIQGMCINVYFPFLLFWTLKWVVGHMCFWNNWFFLYQGNTREPEKTDCSGKEVWLKQM